MLACVFAWKRRLLSGVWKVPFRLCDADGCMWSIVKWAFLVGIFPVLNLLDLFADGDHGIDEAIEFVEGLAFCGFDHECASDRP